MSRSLIFNNELILSGDVVDDSQIGWMWEEDVFFAPSMVREALAQLGDGHLTVRLNSHGGHVYAGEQIRAMLAAHPGGCRIVVEGIAASAASLILMAGAARVMSAGSHIMIHDPSGITFGDAATHRQQADQLDMIASTYAAVYAAASGKTAEEMRNLMRANGQSGSWFGPAAAVAEGFADEVEENAKPITPIAVPAEMKGAQQHYMSATARLRQRLDGSRNPDRAAPPAPAPAAAGGQPSMEGSMPQDPKNQTPAASPATPAAPASPSAPAPTMQANPADIIAQERARVREIREMAAPHVTSGRLMQADVDALVDEGVSADVAGRRFMATMAAQEPVGRSTNPAGGPRSSIQRDESETRVNAMIGALMGETEGAAAQYRGMRVRHLAMELGGNGRGYSDPDTIRRGMRATTMMGGAYGVSDFAFITTEVMNRSLQEAYRRRNASWQLVTGAPLTATDFRELHSVRFGGDFSLKPVKENGEYQSAVLADEAEGLKVERRGRTINLTFEAVVNDDMGAFQRIPTEFAMAARTMEASMVWSLIRSNARLKSDGLPLFHADHGNLGTGGGAAGTIGIAAVGAARKAMWGQRAYGSRDRDDFLQIEPDRLIVPPALELLALQFATTITPGTDANVNPYKSTLTPAVIPNLGAEAGGSDTAWYLFSSDLPPIAHAYLEGYAAPTVQTIEGMNPDLVKMDARHIFGAAVVDYRGAYKVNGA
ncbi:head maturation protease, ClpP-related [Paracoccus tibetensis]|uniref:ATP-dependent protease ClpP, protease subunit n=1 Tax=Paracoccus tibetensis TaxID=336292 RepID=A0A1G5HD13_9RHOB|nr:head maturation protease, ClpP-related [Paracoccus tibetensis]SCY61653.1 ATP-dependent protease ClpP, protease subunit [Paracoccus tibetensis]